MTEHDPDRVSAKCVAGFRKACPRARPEGSCSNQNIERDDDSKKSHHALVDERSGEVVRLRDIRPQAGPGADDLVRWCLTKFGMSASDASTIGVCDEVDEGAKLR